MKIRKKLARLGKVRPSHAGARYYRATSNAATIRFQQLWSRSGDVIDVPISDVLDFALHRRLVAGDRRITLSLCPAGIAFREEGQIGEQVVSFRDLVEFIHGQRLISYAP